MQQCTKCQADLPANAQFCSHCGTPADVNQKSATPPAETTSSREDLEITSKQPIITVPSSADLPVLRTRRIHPQSPIPASPARVQFSHIAEDDVESTIPASRTRVKQESATPALSIPLTPPIAAPADLGQIPETPALSEAQASTMDEVQDATLHPTTPLDETSNSDGTNQAIGATPSDLASISTASTGTLTHTPDVTPDEIAASPTGDLAHIGASDDIATAPTNALASEEPSYASPYPPPTPERRSTPRPSSVKTGNKRRDSMATHKQDALRGGMLVIALVVIIVLVGLIGVFALQHLHASAGSSTQCRSQNTNCAGSPTGKTAGAATRLTFAGTVAGPMSIVAKPTCQSASAGNLRTLTINLSGTINNQLYNFGFVIERYHGPGTYNNATATITILLDTPGQTTNNGWGNSVPTDTGTITVLSNAQSGDISYTLSGTGTQANTQVQVHGNWTCGG